MNDSWILFTLALPTFFSDLSDFEQGEAFIPYIEDLPHTAQIAGWEILEINDGPTVHQFSEMEALFKAAGNWPDVENLDKCLDLATRDPLVALTYYGGWIMNHGTRLKRSEKAISLLRAAFQSEPNPLANATSKEPLFDLISSIANEKNAPAEIRWEALQIGLPYINELDALHYFPFQILHLTLAKAQGTEAETKARNLIKKDLLARIGQDTKENDYILFRIFSATSWYTPYPKNKIIELLNLLSDAQTTKAALLSTQSIAFKSEDQDSLPFLFLCLELCSPETKINAAWIARADAAFNTLVKSKDTFSYYFWHSLLCDLLLSKKADPAVITTYRKAIVQSFLSQKQIGHRFRELIRYAALLAESCEATGNPAPIDELFPQIISTLESGRIPDILRECNEQAMKLPQSLATLGRNDFASSIAKLLLPQLAMSNKQEMDFKKYITTPTIRKSPLKHPAPTPNP